MAWTQPKTWSSEPLIAGDMNTHIRDNLLAIRQPPSDSAFLAASVTITSTVLVSVSPTFEFTITTNGFDVLFGFSGRVQATNSLLFDVEVDGTNYVNNINSSDLTATFSTVDESGAFVLLMTGISAGTHTFKLKARVAAGSGVVRGGTQCWVREVS